MLMTFWLVFAGEHCINEAGAGERNGLKAYWKKLASVLLGCTFLFIFDMCERGVQLRNPFYSIWDTDIGTNFAMGFIILAALSAGAFFLVLCYMIYRVFMTISEKQVRVREMVVSKWNDTLRRPQARDKGLYVPPESRFDFPRGGAQSAEP
jgi:hypothetical protein